MEDKYYPEFCYGEDFCGETKCENVELNTYNGCKECLKKRIEDTKEFLKQIEQADILTECETNAQAREKLHRFILQLKQFQEKDLLKMQSYLKQFYVLETNSKISETIGDMHTLIRYIKEFLYGTK